MINPVNEIEIARGAKRYYSAFTSMAPCFATKSMETRLYSATAMTEDGNSSCDIDFTNVKGTISKMSYKMLVPAKKSTKINKWDALATSKALVTLNDTLDSPVCTVKYSVKGLSKSDSFMVGLRKKKKCCFGCGACLPFTCCLLLVAIGIFLYMAISCIFVTGFVAVPWCVDTNVGNTTSSPFTPTTEAAAVSPSPQSPATTKGRVTSNEKTTESPVTKKGQVATKEKQQSHQ